MNDMHSVWLMPGTDDEAMLSAIVADLAEIFGSEIFIPHLTLIEDGAVDATSLTRQVRGIVPGVQPFQASVRGVRTGEAFFRSFYALFQAEGPLLVLKERAIEMIATSPIEAFMPHISLAYGVGDTARRRSLADTMDQRLAGRPIHFERVCVVRSAQSIPIVEWGIVHSVPLG